MLRTEPEAKKCWCPFARVVGDDERIAANRWPEDEDAKATTTNCCIASACMAWRWGVTGGLTADKSGRASTGGMQERGYCGIAGKVE